MISSPATTIRSPSPPGLRRARKRGRRWRLPLTRPARRRTSGPNRAERVVQRRHGAVGFHHEHRQAEQFRPAPPVGRHVEEVGRDQKRHAELGILVEQLQRHRDVAGLALHRAGRDAEKGRRRQRDGHGQAGTLQAAGDGDAAPVDPVANDLAAVGGLEDLLAVEEARVDPDRLVRPFRTGGRGGKGLLHGFRASCRSIPVWDRERPLLPGL